ncbi:hypothetical protein BOX15_Mlig003453g1 [Macrostomum lignano]|uniref:Mediator of RNA polymerase II transcription subunit 17 n=1 Tax=Macrostomum lignano TaxID=282301 RepID=A0A267EGA9_9PLAT|nr:hypothetical protein BOX15_Mlig003453g1 [Macrostomum lignano]
MNPAGVQISAECLPEYTVERINPDGSEVHEKPPTASEAFCQLVSKIKFQQWDEDLEEFVSEVEPTIGSADEQLDDSNLSTGGGQQQAASLGPANAESASYWQNIRLSIAAALDETTALMDLLIALRQRPQALTLEPMQRDVEKYEQRIQLVVQGKKKCVQAAAEVLEKGRGSNQMLQQEVIGNFELQQIAQCWKLRRVANTISGDLSLRSAGSRYPDSGGFELRTAKDSSFEVLLPGHLYGQACVQVTLRTSSGESLFPQPAATELPRVSLCNSQRLLLAQELYNTICCECVQAGIRAGPDAVELPLAPGLCANVSLYKVVGPEIQQQQQEQSAGMSSKPLSQQQQQQQQAQRLPRPNYLSNVLECLLLKRHQQARPEPGPFPSCAPAGLSERRCEAGPFSRPVPEPETGLLDRLAAICRHSALYREVANLLEAWPLAEPRLVWHWQTGSSTSAHVAVEFVRRSYDLLRSRALISIGDRKAVLLTTCGQRVAARLGDVKRLLQPCLLREADRHLLLCVHSASTSLGWHLLANSSDPAASLLRSPDGQCSLLVQLDSNRKFAVSVNRGGNGDKWRRVQLDRLAGANALEKLDHVLAALTPLSNA